MKISDTAKYFNSGIMIIDVEEWRRNSISEKVISFINNNSKDMFVFHDQDALNAILYDKWYGLHPRWNAQTHIMLKEKTSNPFGQEALYGNKGKSRNRPFLRRKQALEFANRAPVRPPLF